MSESEHIRSVMKTYFTLPSKANKRARRRPSGTPAGEEKSDAVTNGPIKERKPIPKFVDKSGSGTKVPLSIAPVSYSAVGVKEEKDQFRETYTCALCLKSIVENRIRLFCAKDHQNALHEDCFDKIFCDAGVMCCTSLFDDPHFCISYDKGQKKVMLPVPDESASVEVETSSSASSASSSCSSEELLVKVPIVHHQTLLTGWREVDVSDYDRPKEKPVKVRRQKNQRKTFLDFSSPVATVSRNSPWKIPPKEPAPPIATVATPPKGKPMQLSAGASPYKPIFIWHAVPR